MEGEMDSIEYDSKRITGTELMSKHTCDLAQLGILSSNGISDLRIYDGVDTNGEYKMRIRTPNSQYRHLTFTPHVYFKVGLYIVFTQKVDSVWVQWRLRPKGES